jgi:hypothetical protein
MTLPLAALLMLAAGDIHIEPYHDQTEDIGAGKIRMLDVPLQEPARVMCTFNVTEGSTGVRVLLMTQAESEKYVRGQASRPLAADGYAMHGAFSEAVPARGLYRIVLDNRMEGGGVTTVRLTVKLAFGEIVRQPAREMDPSRRTAIILASFAVFLMIVAPAGIALRRRIPG